MNSRTISRLADIAKRIAGHPSTEAAVMGAVRATLPGVIVSVLQEMYPGEEVCLYIPKTGQRSETQRDRDRRIRAAIAAGEAPERIAKRESVSERHIRRIRGRLGGQLPP